jgi:hypothetical protein
VWMTTMSSIYNNISNVKNIQHNSNLKYTQQYIQCSVIGI